jgi:hypothetical protein
MGLAWSVDDAGRSVPGAPSQDWPARRRHRRPTLLARGGHAVAGRITALAGTALAGTPLAGTPLAGTDLDASGQPPAAHLLRRPALPARRYWT